MRKSRAETEGGGKRSFEGALARLEEIVEQLEGSEVSLEQAIALVQEGEELARACEQQLQQAEGKILQLVERLGGVALEPVAAETEEEEQ